MEKIFLVIVFIAGLKLCVGQWKYVFKRAIELRMVYHRGFNSDNYPDCCCPECQKLSMEEKRINKKERFDKDFQLIVKETINTASYTIFISGITLIILYLFFK